MNRGGRSRGSGRSSHDRKHSRPAGASAPAAESAARVSRQLDKILSHRGVTVADVAEVLHVRGVDVARWRRGQPIPAYRREELEAKIAKLVVVKDDLSGEIHVEIASS